MLTVGIVGASGYTGLELIRLVLKHPELELGCIISRTYHGQKLGSAFPQFLGEDIVFETMPEAGLDSLGVNVLFLALPHGHSHVLADQIERYQGIVIDLSADFRLNDVTVFDHIYQQKHQAELLNRSFVLGIPELKRDALAHTDYVACPGCYSTSVMLALYPLVELSEKLGPVIVDAKSGITGAGRSAKLDYLYSECSNTFSAYTSGSHRHTAEIEQEIGASIVMTNYLVPMNRGIISTCYLIQDLGLDARRLMEQFDSYYDKEHFVEVVDDVRFISTKYVKGTNRCLIYPTIQQGSVIVFSVIDNLMKGASSQAVQCLNVRMGWSESLGLDGRSFCS